MLHQPTSNFRLAPPSSRVAVLAADYERWCEAYRQAGLAEERLSDRSTDAEREQIDEATREAVYGMHEAMDELTMTPARTLHDFGLKALVVREFQKHEWYNPRLSANLDRGELLARSMMVELSEISDLVPIGAATSSPPEPLPISEKLPLSNAAQAADGRAELSALSGNGCSVAKMAHRFSAAHRAYELLDFGRASKGDASEADELTFTDAARRASDLMEVLENAAPFQPSTSAEGAMFQLIVTFAALNRILDNLPEALQERAMYSGEKQKAEAALWHVRSFLEGHFQIDGDALGGSFFMSSKLSPSRVVERAVTRLQEVEARDIKPAATAPEPCAQVHH